MQNTILTTIIALGLTLLTVIVGMSLLFIIVRRKLRAFMSDFLTPPDEKTPSKLAILANQFCVLAAQHLVSQVKTTLMGMASVDARQEAKAQEAGNPITGVLASFLPKKFAKAIGNSPVLTDLILGYLSKNKVDASKNGGAAAGTYIPPKTQYPLI